MSLVKKTKNIVTELSNSSDTLPSQGQKIVKIIGGRGNNLHEVEDIFNGEMFLVSMPVRFRKLVWIKCGDYVIVEPIIEGKKVKAEIIEVLTKDKIRFLKRNGFWPDHCQIDEEDKFENVYEFVNTNRKEIDDCENNSSDSDSE